MGSTLLIACAAGVVGTGLGGIFGLLFARRGKGTLGCLMAFSGGVMMSIVCFDLIPQARLLLPLPLVVLGIVIGVLTVQVLGCLTQGLVGSTTRSKGLLQTGLIMLVAIALHNLPEGLAIGSLSSHSVAMGKALALLIALHNIPEGIGIGLPLVAGGMGRGKALLLTALSGAPTLLGALFGLLMGGVGDRAVGLALCLAAGAMLYVTYSEIEPQVNKLELGFLPAFWAVGGLVFGWVMVQLIGA